MKQLHKIKNFTPLHYFEIEKTYNNIQREIKVFESKLESEIDTLKFSERISIEKKITRLRETAENLIDKINEDNKIRVYHESLKSRMVSVLDKLNLKKTNKGWFKEDKSIKSFSELCNEIKSIDESLIEEYTKEFEKKKVLSILKTQHFFWFGSDLNKQWMNNI